MKETKEENRSRINQIIAIGGGLLVLALCVNGVKHDNSSLLTEEHEVVRDTLKITRAGNEGVLQAPEILSEQPYTLKTDPLTGQVHFNTKTVDISVLNREKDREKAEKVAIIQKDLQSRIKLTGLEQEALPLTEVKDVPPTKDPIEMTGKQVKVKQDLESRIAADDDGKRYKMDNDDLYEEYGDSIKRAEVEYYEDEPTGPDNPSPASLHQRLTTEAPKEEDSFFSIFESLFGSGDEGESQDNKSKLEAAKTPTEEANMKQNIKTVGEILKPSPAPVVEEVKVKKGSSYEDYDEPQEYRIVNDFPQKQGFRPSRPRPYHQYAYQRPNSMKPYQQYRPYPSPGYEDYDLDEFAEKKDDKFNSDKSTTPKGTSLPTAPTTRTTTTDSIFNRKPPKIAQAEKKTEKETHLGAVDHSFDKNYNVKQDFETKMNEPKPEKIQDSANFYNLINLPVRYSTKDTAIPLISTSYANTKIQGMGAHKYEKNNNGKHPNHKYDSTSIDARTTIATTTTTTRRPSYWSARRTTTTTTSSTTTTRKPVTAARPTSTIKNIPSTTDFSSLEYDDLAIGSSANFGGYGNKADATKNTETRIPYTKNRESTTRRVFAVEENKETLPRDTYSVRPEKESFSVKDRTTERTLPPTKEIYDEYEYESIPAMVEEMKPAKESTNVRLHSSYSERNRIYETDAAHKKINDKIGASTTKVEPEQVDQSEYEYYEYDTDALSISATTGTTTAATITTAITPTSPTTLKYRVKYPNLKKDTIKNTGGKLTVVMAANNQDFHGSHKDSQMRVTPIASLKPTAATTTRMTTTTTSTATERPTPSPDIHEPTQSQASSNLKQTYINNYSYAPKEPAPVFEDIDDTDEYMPKPVSIHLTRRTTTTTERPTTYVKPIIVTATKKDQENNVNIVLVPMKEPQRPTQRPEESTKSRTEVPSLSHGKHKVPSNLSKQEYHQNFEYTTEFTVGAIQGHGGGVSASPEGHFVATSISANPYEDDEPFRPIPKPSGFSAGFQVVTDQKVINKGSQAETGNRRPTPQLNIDESDPIHEPHEFIPSPQFHRPGETKIANAVIKSGESQLSVDYDFDGIQTEPKPGQYVIFSKPQLNPEMNDGNGKKKPDETPWPKIPRVPQNQESVSKFGGEIHKQVIYNPKMGEYQANVPDIKSTTSDKSDPKHTSYAITPELTDDRMLLQLVPPKGVPTEKPFDANFVTPEYDKAENAANYPRPHWEKTNNKPAFLFSSQSNKNEITGSRAPAIPPQMAPTLIPPSSAIPQRFRKPLPPHVPPPIRKNFNEGSASTKPKPNLPNILPQFRPNAKIGTGPYQRPFHRPPGYVNGNANRRNGPNRYHEKEANFPYHIHHPGDKDMITHQMDFEAEPDIYPKFITNRGKIPAELLESHAMRKRYGGGPPNVQTTNRNYEIGSEGVKLLRRLQRTPVTTLQMLQQTPGVRTHKNPVRREDGIDPSIPMVPPVYLPYKDNPTTERNVHLVYPSNVPKNRLPLNNEHHKSYAFDREFTNSDDQYPLLNLTERPYQDVIKNEFPYGFVTPDDKIKLTWKYVQDNRAATKKNVKVSTTEQREIKPNLQDYMPSVTKKATPSSETNDDKIDMNLHMQSNNQWNKVKTLGEDSIDAAQDPLDGPRSTELNVQKHDSKLPDAKRKGSEGSQLRTKPPIEYHTSIQDQNVSAFTLGAVMHAASEHNKNGEPTNAALRDNFNITKLDVNQKISNGKIITVSMPLDIKEDEKEKETDYNFQAPFQASSSITVNGAEPTNQGWSVVKGEEKEGNLEGVEEMQSTGGSRNNTKLNFQNFKPELIGGFKPIYELPYHREPIRPNEENKNREEER